MMAHGISQRSLDKCDSTSGKVLEESAVLSPGWFYLDTKMFIKPRMSAVTTTDL